MVSPESQAQAVERQLNLVEGTNYSVEIIYFEDQAEHQNPPAGGSNFETQTISLSPETSLLPAVDLIDFAEPELATITSEPLYVWADDPQTAGASPDQRAASTNRGDTLQSDAQAWELAA
jgi:hypothetical protein